MKLNNPMNMNAYRASNKEQERINNLLSLVVPGKQALDVGARDGYVSIKLTSYFDSVFALDLEEPVIKHEKIKTHKGDITQLDFPDDFFSLVLCAEVLEHIPSALLERACDELARVTENYLIIGVPFNQDIRFGRTTCRVCGKSNPPWGHVNQFDESRLRKLFPDMLVENISYIGRNSDRTNWLSALFMDLAGNPYGTYSQEESCIFCSDKLTLPGQRNLFQKICTKLAFILNRAQKPLIKEQPNWIHILFKK